MNFPVIRSSVWHRGLALLLMLFCAIALQSCDLKDYLKAEARVPEIVHYNLSDPKTFNPALSEEYPNIFLYTHDGLVFENGRGELEPALAESWEITDDNKKIVVTLREGLKWSDGEPLTADDVVFTYNEVYFNEAIPTSTRDILRVGESGTLPEVRKLDDRRVEFTTIEPFAPMLRNLEADIMPAHSLRAALEEDSDGKIAFLSTWGVDADPSTIVGNGAYMLDRYVTSERVVFKRNPYSWRKDEQGDQQPYIDRFVWQIVESTDTALLKFRSGELDSIGVSPQYFSLLKSEEKRGNFNIYDDGPASGTTFICFNLNKGTREGKPLIDPIKSRWFNTLEFRQAVAYSIDRQAMIRTTFQGLGEPQIAPLSVQSPFYAPEGLPTYDYNPKKAKELLLSAGFQYNAQDELLDSDGNRVKFTLITNAGNKSRESMGAQIRQDLAKIGIQVDFEPLAFNVLVDKLTNSLDWDCHLIGFTGGVEPHGGMNVWSPDGRLHSFNQITQPGQTPVEGREVYPWEAKIGELYIEGARELDEAKRKAIYAETQQIAMEYLPYIYLVNPLAMAAVRDRIEGVEYSALNGIYWNLYEQQLKGMGSGAATELTE